MAFWAYRGPKAGVILTPKVCSRSIVRSIEGQAWIAKPEKPFAICLRHPMDRAAALLADSETWDIIERSSCSERFGRKTITDHKAPQVDYINFRLAGGTGTHRCIPYGADGLLEEPDFVFFYEDLPDSYYALMEFIGVEIDEIPHENAHKSGRDYREVLGDLAPEFEELYAKDIAFYERMRRECA